jgi:simple sugar transport system permease protein
MQTKDPARGRGAGGGFRSIWLRPEVTALLSTIAVFLFFAAIAGNQGFLTFEGTKNYLQVAALIGIIATPVTLLLIAGEFDLSVGTMIGASGIVIAYCVTTLGWPLWAAILLGLCVALAVGGVNGLMVVHLGVPSFLVTLGMMFVMRGLTLAGTLLIVGTTQIAGLKRALKNDVLYPVFSAKIHGLPISIFWWLGLAALAAYALVNTKQGNWIYAVGGDRDAATKMGVPVARVKIALFVLTSASAVIVAMLNMFYVDLAEAQQGIGREFEAITAAVVGGSAITGGFGSPLGTIFGALIFGIINQGFFYTNISDSWFYTVVGATLLVAVVINARTRQAATGTGAAR